jgi:hypothetical protein
LLWTVAAGPLVNVALAPISFGLFYLGDAAGWEQTAPEVHRLLEAFAIYNLALLIFNLLPIFPLDGGQILQALLWFVVGRATSLKVVAMIGFVAGLGLIALGVFIQDWFLVVLAVFLAIGSINGVARAETLRVMAQAERRQDLACPLCGTAPPVGEFWRCAKCMAAFDLFAPATTCRQGGVHATMNSCLECGGARSPREWIVEIYTAQAAPEESRGAGPENRQDGFPSA